MKNFSKIFEIYLNKDTEQVGCMITNDFEIEDATTLVGAMVSMLDAVVNQLQEKDQVEFEQQILALFPEFVEKRYEFTSKQQIDEDDD